MIKVNKGHHEKNQQDANSLVQICKCKQYYFVTAYQTSAWQEKGLSLPLPGAAPAAPVDEAEKTELEEQLQAGSMGC